MIKKNKTPVFNSGNFKVGMGLSIIFDSGQGDKESWL